MKYAASGFSSATMLWMVLPRVPAFAAVLAFSVSIIAFNMKRMVVLLWAQLLERFGGSGVVRNMRFVLRKSGALRQYMVLLNPAPDSKDHDQFQLYPFRRSICLGGHRSNSDQVLKPN